MPYPLRRVINSDKLKLVKSLIREGTDVNQIDKHNRSTPFPNFKSNDELIDFIEKNPNLIDEYNDEGMTFLSSAIKYGKNDVAKFLLQKGAKLGKKNADGSTPVTLAIEHKNYDMLALLAIGEKANRCADLNQVGIKKITPLSLSVLLGDIYAAEFLLRNGAKRDKPNDDGSTPLLIAIITKNLNMIKLLLTCGADVNAPGLYRKTPLEVAKGTGDKSIIDFIEAYHNSLKPTNTNNLTAIVRNLYKKSVVYEASLNGEINIRPKCAFYKTKEETENKNSLNTETNNSMIKP